MGSTAHTSGPDIALQETGEKTSRELPD